MPVTVWMLDPYSTATVGELRARLHATVTVLDHPRGHGHDDHSDRDGDTTRRTEAAEQAGTGIDEPQRGVRPPSPRHASADGAACAMPPSCRATVESQSRFSADHEPRAGSPMTSSDDSAAPAPAPCDGGPVRGAPVAGTVGWSRASRRCMVLDLRRSGADARRIAAAAAGIEQGDVLAVLTLSHHRGGRLWDPRPELVRTAAAAGLAYRQHIVTITRPETGVPGWVLGPDISLFQPTTPTPTAPTPTTADAAVQSCSREDV